MKQFNTMKEFNIRVKYSDKTLRLDDLYLDYIPFQLSSADLAQH